MDCLEACNFILKETLAQVFYCEFCQISKNTYFHRTRLVAAFKKCILSQIISKKIQITLNI